MTTFRILVLGNEASGKTALCHHLKYRRFAPSVRGTKTRPFSLSLSSLSPFEHDDVIFSIAEAGADDEYDHFGGGFGFDLGLVCVDTSAESDDWKDKDTLSDVVKTTCGIFPRVMVVGTKLDATTDRRRIQVRQVLDRVTQKLGTSCVRQVSISVKTGENIDIFYRELANFVCGREFNRNSRTPKSKRGLIPPLAATPGTSAPTATTSATTTVTASTATLAPTTTTSATTTVTASTATVAPTTTTSATTTGTASTATAAPPAADRHHRMLMPSLCPAKFAAAADFLAKKFGGSLAYKALQGTKRKVFTSPIAPPGTSAATCTCTATATVTASAATMIPPSADGKQPRACADFKVDMTHTLFGMCKCGWHKRDHKKRRRKRGAPRNLDKKVESDRTKKKCKR